MFDFSLSSLLAALGVAAALQIPYLLLRRHFPRLLERLRYQSWAISSAAAIYGVLSGVDLATSRPFQVATFVAVVLTIELAYHGLDRLWLSALVDSRGRHLIPQLVRDLGGWLVVAAALVGAGVKIFQLPLGQWALPSAVVSAVLGFALQDVLKNVFAGLALQTETPFDIGDWLLVDNDPRQVLEMTWRSTHLRNSLGVDFREPNANIANQQITNLGSGTAPMGFEIHVSVAYEAPPAEVKRSLERAARSSSHVVAEPAPFGVLDGFGDSGVQYKVRFWTHDVHQITRALDEVRSRVWYQLRRDGFVIPFPIRTVQYEPVAETRAATRAKECAELEALLARSDLFGVLPESARTRLAAGGHRLHFDAGERLVREGEPGDSLMLLARGAVAISKSGEEIGSTSVSLATLTAGAYFGEMSLLTGAPRSANITAASAVELFVLDREAIAPVLESDPAIAVTLSRVLAERTAATRARFDNRREELSRQVDTDRLSILSRIRGLFSLRT